jgi:hypothetical protein
MDKADHCKKDHQAQFFVSIGRRMQNMAIGERGMVDYKSTTGMWCFKHSLVGLNEAFQE